jgi:hypothetical protein
MKKFILVTTIFFFCSTLYAEGTFGHWNNLDKDNCNKIIDALRYDYEIVAYDIEYLPSNGSFDIIETLILSTLVENTQEKLLIKYQIINNEARMCYMMTGMQ